MHDFARVRQQNMIIHHISSILYSRWRHICAIQSLKKIGVTCEEVKRSNKCLTILEVKRRAPQN
jgi:hypothetical protein